MPTAAEYRDRMNKLFGDSAPVESPAQEIPRADEFRDRLQQIQVQAEQEPTTANGFDAAYADVSQSLGLDPNPDDPRHHYDYRSAFKKYGPSFGVKDGHFPSEFKDASHPNRFVDGVDTISGVEMGPPGLEENPIPDVVDTSNVGKSTPMIYPDKAIAGEYGPQVQSAYTIATDVVNMEPGDGREGALRYYATSNIPDEERNLTLLALQQLSHANRTNKDRSVAGRMASNAVRKGKEFTQQTFNVLAGGLESAAQSVAGLSDEQMAEARTPQAGSPTYGLSDKDRLFYKAMQGALDAGDPITDLNDPVWAQFAIKAAGIAPGMAAGIATGNPIAAAGVWWSPIYEDSRDSLLAKGVDPTTARYAGAVSATIQSAIETLNINPFKGGTQSVVNEGLQDYLKRFGKAWSKEAIAEEGLQGATQAVTEYVATKADEVTTAQGIGEGMGDAIRAAVTSATEAAGPMGMLMLPAFMAGLPRASRVSLMNKFNANMERAYEIARKEQPSRKDVPELSKASERAELAEALRESLRVPSEKRAEVQSELDQYTKSLEVRMPEPWEHGPKYEPPQTNHDDIKLATDREATFHAWKAVDDAIGGIKAQEHKAANTARRTRAALKKDIDREDVTAFMEGTHNVNLEGDTAEAAKKRVESNPKALRIARELRNEYNRVRDEANAILEAADDNTRISYIADYVAHFWDLPKDKAIDFASKWSKNIPHAKQRKLPTYADGVALGYRPFSTDAAFLFQKYASNVARGSYTRAMIADLKRVRLPDGSKALTWKEQPGYTRIENPLFQRMGPEGQNFGKAVYVHPSMERPMRVLLEKPFTGNISKFIAGWNSAAKAIEVGLSLFHEVALFESAQASLAKPSNPLRGYVVGPFEAKKLFGSYKPRLTHRAGLLLDEKDPNGTEDAIKHGLETGRNASSDMARGTMEGGLLKAEKYTNIAPGLSHVVRGVRRGVESYNRHLWDNVHTGLKLFSYHTLASEIVPQAQEKGVDVDRAKSVIADFVNNAYGGQRFETGRWLPAGEFAHGMTAKQRQIAYAIIFAPDWTLSNIKVAGNLLYGIKDPTKRKLYTRYWRNMAISQTAHVVAAQAAIYAAFGDDDPDMKQYPWENEPGHKWDIDITGLRRAINNLLGVENDDRRHYIKLGKQWREVIRYLERFPDGLLESMGKKSSVVMRSAWALLPTTTPLGSMTYPWPWVDTPTRKATEGKVLGRLKYLGSQFFPFSVQGNSFAFSVPESRGMTAYSAVEHYAPLIRAYADPKSFQARLKKLNPFARETASAKAMKEIDAALEANGATIDQRKNAWSQARSDIATDYFNRMLGNLERKDFDKAEYNAGVIVRIGVNIPSRVRNAYQRGDLTDDMIPDLQRVFGNISDGPKWFVPQWPFDSTEE